MLLKAPQFLMTRKMTYELQHLRLYFIIDMKMSGLLKTRKNISLCKVQEVIYLQACSASTGGRGNTKNYSRRNKRRFRGIKVADGDYVHKGYMLASQIHTFKFYPGANVAVGRNMTLTALVSGMVRITTEAFVPKPESDLGEAVKKMPIGSVIYKPTINIVKEKEIGKFILKEQI